MHTDDGDRITGEEHRVDRSVAHLGGYGVVHEGVLAGRDGVLDDVTWVDGRRSAVEIVGPATATDGVRTCFDRGHKVSFGQGVAVEGAFVTVHGVCCIKQLSHPVVKFVDVVPRDGGHFSLRVERSAEALCLVPRHLVNIGVSHRRWRDNQQRGHQKQQDES